jgi:hypothetical protein
MNQYLNGSHQEINLLNQGFLVISNVEKNTVL